MQVWTDQHCWGLMMQVWTDHHCWGSCCCKSTWLRLWGSSSRWLRPTPSVTRLQSPPESVIYQPLGSMWGLRCPEHTHKPTHTHTHTPSAAWQCVRSASVNLFHSCNWSHRRCGLNRLSSPAPHSAELRLIHCGLGFNPSVYHQTADRGRSSRSQVCVENEVNL